MTNPAALLRHPSHQRSWIEVDLSAIEDNILALKKWVSSNQVTQSGGVKAATNVGLMPAVKNDAYGHGAVAVAMTSLAAGAKALAVANCQEGEELRVAGITAPIQILGALMSDEIPPAIANNLTISIHEAHVVDIICQEARRQNKRVRVHIKVDTGMGRLGIRSEKLAEIATNAAARPELYVEGVFMHFADPGDDAYSLQQIEHFNQALESLRQAKIKPDLVHAADTPAAVLYPQAIYDCIRPGAGLYGFHSPAYLHRYLPLTPALSWRARIIQVKDYPSGSSLGYNRTFTTHRPTRVAVIPVGYGDGYLREFSNKAQVLVNGQRAPVVGIISMDYMMADVTDLPAAQAGDIATLIGQDGNDSITLEELANQGNTIPYVITCNLGRRPGRYYTRREE